MRRNCNLKLQLQASDNGSKHHLLRQQQPIMMEEVSSAAENRQLTIFYNGQVRVCDVTEFQARAIIMLASRETTGNSPPPSRGDTSTTAAAGEYRDQQHASSGLSPPTSNNYYRTINMMSPSSLSPALTGLSMKRSLQRFLQKRSHRMSASSPYNVR